MNNRDLGIADVIGHVTPDVERDDMARAYLERNGHSDLLEVLGLEPSAALRCPRCRRAMEGKYGRAPRCPNVRCNREAREQMAARDGMAKGTDKRGPQGGGPGTTGGKAGGTGPGREGTAGGSGGTGGDSGTRGNGKKS